MNESLGNEGGPDDGVGQFCLCPVYDIQIERIICSIFRESSAPKQVNLSEVESPRAPLVAATVLEVWPSISPHFSPQLPLARPSCTPFYDVQHKSYTITLLLR